MVDPVALSVMTSCICVLGNECAKGVASAAGEQVWSEIKQLFAWSNEPAPSELAETTAKRLIESPEILERVKKLLSERVDGNTPSLLVGSVYADKSVVASTINTEHFTM